VPALAGVDVSVLLRTVAFPGTLAALHHESVTASRSLSNEVECHHEGLQSHRARRSLERPLLSDGCV